MDKSNAEGIAGKFDLDQFVVGDSGVLGQVESVAVEQSIVVGKDVVEDVAGQVDIDIAGVESIVVGTNVVEDFAGQVDIGIVIVEIEDIAVGKEVAEDIARHLGVVDYIPVRKTCAGVEFDMAVYEYLQEDHRWSNLV